MKIIIIPDETKTESIGVTPKPINPDFGPAFEVWGGGGINSWDNLLKYKGKNKCLRPYLNFQIFNLSKL